MPAIAAWASLSSPGGTVFLDEIGELPLAVQGKLLRAIEEKTIDRIGGRAPLPVDVRIVAATNKDLKAAVEKGEFRGDLFFRLAVFPIEIPAFENVIMMSCYWPASLLPSSAKSCGDEKPSSARIRFVHCERTTGQGMSANLKMQSNGPAS